MRSSTSQRWRAGSASRFASYDVSSLSVGSTSTRSVGSFGSTRRKSNGSSSDPEFPDGVTLRIKTGSSTNRSLTKKELEVSQEMSALNGEGGVYWRVIGRDARGNELRSQTYFFYVTD